MVSFIGLFCKKRPVTLFILLTEATPYTKACTDSILFYVHTYTDVRFYARLQNPATIHTQRYTKLYKFYAHPKDITTIHIQRYTKIYNDAKINGFYAHPKDPTTIHTQKYTKYKNILIVCTPKGYEYYTHAKIYKDKQRCTKIQRYTDSMHIQRI